MKTHWLSPVLGLLICVVLNSCIDKVAERQLYTELLAADLTICNSSPKGYTFSFASFTPVEMRQYDHPRLVYSDRKSKEPKVRANNNRIPAGTLNGNTLDIDLEVAMGDFYPETDDRPGLKLAAIREKGKDLSIPAPLIRVEEGTIIHASISNTLQDSSITVFGLQERPAEERDSLIIYPGQTAEITFNAGEQGTYFYWMTIGSNTEFRQDGEEEQLSGAFVVDTVGGSPPDRILMMNIFSTDEDDTLTYDFNFLEALTINGRSWPFSELMQHEVGDTVRWKVINATARNHPMHLHGFYFNLKSKGDYLKNTHYKLEESLQEVTDMMSRRETIELEWVASRPGRWLFHCHLSFHVSNGVRLPGSDDLDNFGHENHMAGLVTGIDIKPGPSDLINKGEERRITMYANTYGEESDHTSGFTIDDTFVLPEGVDNSPGPLLVLKQFQPTYITVKNRMNDATSVHWHGLEIDSWSDGVPNWSSSEGKTSPIVEPGEEFEYKLSLMRPGTFIYHSHLDDINQLTSGLYGALIVMGEDETYDPSTDHNYIISWTRRIPRSFEEIELNGKILQADRSAKVGETHRLRLMNIAPAGRVSINVTKDGKAYPIKYLAKDGADLPVNMQIMTDISFRYGVGETADFQFVPKEAGEYIVEVRPGGGDMYFKEKWIVQ